MCAQNVSNQLVSQSHGAQVPLRFVTAASLFDGHDASINIMRRILQASGVEVIHLAYNRSVAEIVETALQEDAQGIAISSYQGGHVEFFKYIVDMLAENDAGHIQVFGGGGGVIIPAEIQELQDYGVARIYSPQDGMQFGLQGMIDDMIKRAREASQGDYSLRPEAASHRSFRGLARLLTGIERGEVTAESLAGFCCDRKRLRSQVRAWRRSLWADAANRRI